MTTKGTTPFQSTGTVRQVGSNTPFLLTNPETVYVVETGQVDVFLVRVANGQPVGARTFLFQALSQDALFGLSETENGFGLLAVGGVGTHVRVLDMAAVKGSDLSVCTPWITSFLCALGGAVRRFENPQLQLLLSPKGTLSVVADQIIGVREEIIWVGLNAATARVAGDEPVSLSQAFPIPEGVWVVSDQAGEWVCETTQTVFTDNRGWPGFFAFYEACVTALSKRVMQRIQREQDRLGFKTQVDQKKRQHTLSVLASLMDPQAATDATQRVDDPNFAAFQALGQAGGISFSPPPRWQKLTKPADVIRAVCRASAIGYRQVVLRDAWWSSDIGPLICLKSVSEGEPALVSALPVKPGVYDLFDPATGSRKKIDEAVAQELEPLAYAFYRPLPAHKLALIDLWRFIVHDLRQDIHVVGLVGGAGFLLGLVMPIMTGYLFNTVIPNADRGQLFEMFIGLLVATLAGALFELTRSFAMLRIETKANAALQMAVFDRILRLPLRFFRGYSAGDLAARANGINALRQALGGATIGAILSGLVSLGNFALLFYYSTTLALVATGVLLLNVILTASFAYFSMQYYRRLQSVAGKLSGLVLQLLTGIAKLRVSGAESRVFSVWAAQYREQKQLAYLAGRLENFQQVFNSFIPVASSLIIFLILMQTMRDDPANALATGDFIAFNAAFGTFLAAAVSLTATLINLLAVIPQLERAKPILETLPEIDPSKPNPGLLEGRLEVSHVTFRYQEDGPLILNDLSFYAEPGEFIAIVGPSGAGKSTLLRMLLGFDVPESGSVYYDGQDISVVDVAAVRQQVGIVLQSSKLTSGSVYDNIVGMGSSLTMDDAWEAARMAGMEADIKGMPMGMHTMVSEGGGTLSGGQRQRLLIARALVSKPRLVFFDEATSALDNRTQQIVSESLERMNATRVVIAHRLSTIQHADRIYVINRGQVVQAGTFAELQAQPGLFADLAARQMA